MTRLDPAVLLSFSPDDARLARTLTTHLGVLRPRGLRVRQLVTHPRGFDLDQTKLLTLDDPSLAMTLDHALAVVPLLSAAYLAALAAPARLGELLQAARAHGVWVVPLIARPVAGRAVAQLGDFKPYNPDRPLMASKPVQRDRQFVALTVDIAALLDTLPIPGDAS